LTATNWIALVQAMFLAVAAGFAARTYQLANREHREARAEARKAPLRGLLDDLVREFKRLAEMSEEREPGIGIQRLDLITGQQRRLEIALTFLPPNAFNLFSTQELTTCAAQEVSRKLIDKARDELLILYARIDDGQFSVRQVAPASFSAERAAKGDF
jgi:hypothetical protein